MSDEIIQILILFLLVAANGIFSMAETAIVAVRKPLLRNRAENGDKGAQAALDLALNPNELLSTVQIGITLIGILAGAIGGVTLGEKLALWLRGIPGLERWGETLGIGIVVTLITLLSVVAGELVPKRLALHGSDRIAVRMAPMMRALSSGMAPIVRFLDLLSDLLMRMIGIGDSEDLPVTEGELRVILRQGTAYGVFKDSERQMIENVLLLDDMSVRALMTPRSEIVWLDVSLSMPEIHARLDLSGFSRFPVARGSLDDMIGFVRARDILALSAADQAVDVVSLIRRPLYLHEDTSVLAALELFRDSQVHLALVTDEHGGIEGLVTHHDLLEAIAGKLPMSSGRRTPVAELREDGAHLLSGLTAIPKLGDMLPGLKFPADERNEYSTLAGFVMARLGRIPQVGEVFDWSGYRFEVVEMDRLRIDKVLISSADGKTDDR